MDLMSTLRLLLFCSAMLSGTEGFNHQKTFEKNNTDILGQVQRNKHLFLNAMKPKLRSVTSEVQFFKDVRCRKCAGCVEKNIKSCQKSKILLEQPENEIYYQIQDDIKRHKRSKDNREALEEGKAYIATVKKYKKDKKLFAIEVKSENELRQTCKLYRVKKTLPCMGERLPKATTKTKKNKKNAELTETVTEAALKSDFKKRRDVNLDLASDIIPEGYMLSTEDFEQ